jgi:O-methyltransferase domain
MGVYTKHLTASDRLNCVKIIILINIDALHSYDFSTISNLCDVGGGQGHLLCHFLVQYPHLRGTTLERSSVIENGQSL